MNVDPYPLRWVSLGVDTTHQCVHAVLEALGYGVRFFFYRPLLSDHVVIDGGG